eukprot:CAMPEP_0181383544 /NCGR_PEP_ID=MMETSP1106-20121128/21414_1 /TAXON_ID=81844 /ORGANISM="Mantoniella antarctica, Strain SL-175" /LENGTH=174 /DNA_ID=CAMNT_0023503207 /DNA_START=150 /DNA_END=671 /DNA_ORIENTATION=-
MADLETTQDVWVCYSIAALVGCFTRGVTGFGAAIAVLSVWALFSVMGAQVGSLQQVVALEGFTGLVTTLPLAAMVDVRGSASWLILASFMPTQCLFIPVGAALLTWMNPAALEKAAGAMILCFLLTQTRLGARMGAGVAAGTVVVSGWMEGRWRGEDGGSRDWLGTRRYEAVTG